MLNYRLVTTYTARSDPFLVNIADLQALQLSGKAVLFSATHLGGGIASYSISAADTPLQRISSQAYGSAQGYLDRPIPALVELGGKFALFATGLGNAVFNRIGVSDKGALTGSFSGPASTELGSDLTHLGGFSTSEGDFLYSARNGSTTLQTWRVDAAGTLDLVSTAALPQLAAGSGAEFDDLDLISVGSRKFLLGVSGLEIGSRHKSCDRMAALVPHR